MSGARRAVFLDRDGTLNAAYEINGISCPPARLEDVVLLPGVEEGVRRLKGEGFVLVVVTNQPDVARGAQKQEVVEQINAYLQQVLPIDALLCCYHDDADACSCRKPAPGLLFRAASMFDLDLPHSFLVGDRWRDVQAGARAGCTTILLRMPWSGDAQPDVEVADFANATDQIVTLSKGSPT